jgi:hypothetical protein
MDTEYQMEKTIHISNVDELLADVLMDCKEKPIRLEIHKNGTQGDISTVLLPTLGCVMEEDGIDFELSSCECIDYDGVEISDFLKRAVFTSSAYEFFNFIFMVFNSVECLVDFTEDAWKLKIIKTEKTKKS